MAQSGGSSKFFQAIGTAPWVRELILNKDGNPRSILFNITLALEHAPELKDAIMWDMFRTETMLMAPVPWDMAPTVPRGWTDQDDREVTAWLQNQGLIADQRIVNAAVETVAQRTAFHSVIEYLLRVRAIGWDGTPRIDTWVMDYCGAADTPFARAVGARWLISAVARIQEPGCKVDTVLVFEGPQGILKSTVFQILGGAFYTNDVAAIGTTAAQEQILGKWIIEFDEMDAVTRGRELAAVKAFISRGTDDFRLPYARRSQSHPRQCVFCATTNPETWHRDTTGARRWWPLKVGIVCPIDTNGLHRDRDQLWAEAFDRWNQGERWWLHEPELIAAQIAEMQSRQEEDPWSDPAVNAARTLTSPSVPYVSLSQVMHEMGIPLDRRDRSVAQRIGALLTHRGWTRIVMLEQDGRPRFYYQKP